MPIYLTITTPFRRKNKHGWSPNDAKHLNAKFETRKGHMTLDLGVVGQPGPVSKAAVEVRSGKGGADINVVSLPSALRIPWI
jgi:hypothetical protein